MINPNSPVPLLTKSIEESKSQLQELIASVVATKELLEQILPLCGSTIQRINDVEPAINTMGSEIKSIATDVLRQRDVTPILDMANSTDLRNLATIPSIADTLNKLIEERYRMQLRLEELFQNISNLLTNDIPTRFSEIIESYGNYDTALAVINDSMVGLTSSQVKMQEWLVTVLKHVELADAASIQAMQHEISNAVARIKQDVVTELGPSLNNVQIKLDSVISAQSALHIKVDNAQQQVALLLKWQSMVESEIPGAVEFFEEQAKAADTGLIRIEQKFEIGIAQLRKSNLVSQLSLLGSTIILIGVILWLGVYR